MIDTPDGTSFGYCPDCGVRLTRETATARSVHQRDRMAGVHLIRLDNACRRCAKRWRAKAEIPEIRREAATWGLRRAPWEELEGSIWRDR